MPVPTVYLHWMWISHSYSNSSTHFDKIRHFNKATITERILGISVQCITLQQQQTRLPLN